MIRMNDLPFMPVELQLAGDQSPFTQRQLLARITASTSKKGQRQYIAVAVCCENPKRSPSAALAILKWRHFDADDRAVLRIIESGNIASMDTTGGQMEKQVDNTRQAKLRQRFGDRRANAFQHFDLGKERVEQFGAHVYQVPP